MLALADLAGSCGLRTTQAEVLLQRPSSPAASSKQGPVGIFVLAAVGFFVFTLLQLKNAETNLVSCIYFYEVPECSGCFANYLRLREIFSYLIKGNDNKAAGGSLGPEQHERGWGSPGSQPFTPCQGAAGAGLLATGLWGPGPGHRH